jgi:uncharacterized protein (UPF0305 family)|tara:strand:+ start:501 stop:920 length:420 start_codon:yes stop_codon:yes gene_type:complete
MNKMKYQAGGAVDSTDDISAEELKEIMQQQKDAEMDANMQKGMENYNKRRVGGQAAKDEAAAKKAAAKKAAAKLKPVDPEGMNMGGMVGYKKGGKVSDCHSCAKTEKKKAGGMVGYKKGGMVRGCGIATQGVRKAKGSY